jgi:hypothetical protein
VDNHEQTLDALRSFKRTVTSVRTALASLAENQIGQARLTAIEADDLNGQVFKVGAYESANAYRHAAGMLFTLEELAAGEVQRRTGFDQASETDVDAIADGDDDIDETHYADPMDRLRNSLRSVQVDRGAVRYRTPSPAIPFKESVWTDQQRPVMVSVAPGRVVTLTAVTEDDGRIRICLLDDDHLKAIGDAFREEEWANGARLAFSTLGGLLRTSNDPAEVVTKAKLLTDRAHELHRDEAEIQLAAQLAALLGYDPTSVTLTELLRDVQNLITTNTELRTEFDKLVNSLGASMSVPPTQQYDQALISRSQVREAELTSLRKKLANYAAATKAAGLTLAEPLPGDFRLIPDGSGKDF